MTEIARRPEILPCPICGGKCLLDFDGGHGPGLPYPNGYGAVRCQATPQHYQGPTVESHERAIILHNYLAVRSPAAPDDGKQAGDDLKAMEARKDAAYLERNQVVAALAKCFPSGVARTAIEGWSEDWHGCVYIDLPTGQASWHFHDSQAYLFADLPPYTKPWDGHTTEEKYQRLAALKAPDDGKGQPYRDALIKIQRICQDTRDLSPEEYTGEIYEIAEEALNGTR